MCFESHRRSESNPIYQIAWILVKSKDRFLWEMNIFIYIYIYIISLICCYSWVPWRRGHAAAPRGHCSGWLRADQRACERSLRASLIGLSNRQLTSFQTKKGQYGVHIYIYRERGNIANKEYMYIFLFLVYIYIYIHDTEQAVPYQLYCPCY